MAGNYDTATAKALLKIFDERCGKYSKPLMTKDHSVVISPPVLLPGETLILQQDKVTCVNTLSRRATGALHLTNYRIIFTGEYMQKTNTTLDLTDGCLSKLGYYHQERKKFFSNVPSNIRRFVPGHKSRSLKHYRKSSKRDLKWTLNKLNMPEEEDDEEEEPQQQESIQSEGSTGSLPNMKSNGTDHFLDSNIGENGVLISLPILSLHDIKKFPRRYLETEKLKMLNDGIEIVTTNFLSVKFCLGEEGSYDSDELISRLMKHSKVKNTSSTFAHVYKGSLLIPKSCGILDDQDAPNLFQIEREMHRLEIGSSSEWKLIDQSVCEFYPNKVIVPFAVCQDNETLKKWGAFHIDNCFPVVVWRNIRTRNLLLRSSATARCRGDKDGRSIIDEDIVRSICSDKNGLYKRLCIFTDTQPSQTSNTIPTNSKDLAIYYPNCEVVLWENLPEICSTQHSTRRLHAVLNRLDDSQYLRNIEESGYLQEINVLLDYAMCVVAKLSKDSSHVLLSVGSGTERVAQLSSLVQILMDPFYRTFDGFQILVQKEWCSMEYPFTKRNLIDFSTEEDISPLFLQFLDCVWQITQQYPIRFEFSNKLLTVLAEHSYSGRFGTFLNEKPQINNNGSTIPIWPYLTLLVHNDHTLLNYNFEESNNAAELRILQPRFGITHLGIWSWFNQYKQDDELDMSSMLGVIELEKLQKEYHELLHQHDSLVAKFSELDEFSDSITSNLRSLSSPDISDDTSSHMSSSQASSSHVETDNVSLGSYRSPVGNKWNSTECLVNGDITETPGAEITKHGKSLFYMPVENGDLNSKIGEETLFSLVEYLINKGIRTEEVFDPRITKSSCCGYLVKRGDVRKSWKKRWFVIDLSRKCVAYFDNPSDVSAKGLFNYLSIKSVYVDKSKENKCTFLVNTNGRTYHIKAPNEKAMQIWMMCFSIPLSLL